MNMPEGMDLEELKHYLRRRCKNELYFLCTGVLGFKDFTRGLHKQSCDFLQKFPWRGDPDLFRKKLLEMPRDHYKSSMASIGLPIFILINDPQRTIALFSANIENTKKWLRAIKGVFEGNEIFRWLFEELIPDLSNPVKWDALEIIINRDEALMPTPQASITASSIQAGQASQHWTDIINDDLVNEHTVKSPSLVGLAVELYKLQEALLQDWEASTMTNVGTPWGFGDPLEYMKENEVSAGHMAFMHYAVYDNANNPIFPEKFPRKELERLEKKLGPFKWSCQYLCDPFDASMGNFEISALKYFKKYASGVLKCECPEHRDHVHRIQDMFLTAQVDPAFSDAEDAAESAVVVNGVAPCECRFLLDCFSDHLDPQQLIDKIFEVCLPYVPYLRKIGIEAVQFQLVYAFWMKSLMRKGQSLPGVEMVDLKPDRGILKEVRIKGQQLPVSNGLWHIRPGQAKFFGQITKFPRVRPIDLLDAWAYCDDLWAVPVLEAAESELSEFPDFDLDMFDGKTDGTGY